MKTLGQFIHDFCSVCIVFCADTQIVRTVFKLMSYFWSTSLQTSNCRYQTMNTIYCIGVFLITCKKVIGDWAQTSFTLVETKKFEQITIVRQNISGGNESELFSCMFYSTILYSVWVKKISTRGKWKTKKWRISHFYAPSQCTLLIFLPAHASVDRRHTYFMVSYFI